MTPLRVAILGAESTGKTTLAAALADAYQTVWVPEYGRAYTERRSDGPWTTEEFRHIARVQAWHEDVSAQRARDLLFCDTDILTTAIFHELYLGRRAPDIEAMARVRHYDLTLLLSPFDFVQDGYRHDPEAQHWMHARLEEALRHRMVARLDGPPAARLSVAVLRINLLTGMRY